jgi:hypothetical protein
VPVKTYLCNCVWFARCNVEPASEIVLGLLNFRARASGDYADLCETYTSHSANATLIS